MLPIYIRCVWRARRQEEERRGKKEKRKEKKWKTLHSFRTTENINEIYKRLPFHTDLPEHSKKKFSKTIFSCNFDQSKPSKILLLLLFQIHQLKYYVAVSHTFLFPFLSIPAQSNMCVYVYLKRMCILILHYLWPFLRFVISMSLWLLCLRLCYIDFYIWVFCRIKAQDVRKLDNLVSTIFGLCNLITF